MQVETRKPSLAHLMRPPLISNQEKAPPLLLLLHGVGSNEQAMFDLAPALNSNFVVVSVRAPFEQGSGRYGWFEVEFRPEGNRINAEQAEYSRGELSRFIGEAVATYGADPRQVYLAGFSQGAIMSAGLALTQPELVAGAVLMSGRILPEIKPYLASRDKLAGLPFLVVHGLYDQVLPVAHGRASRDFLTSLAVEMTYREYEMGHEICRESLAGVVAWLARRLEGSRPN